MEAQNSTNPNDLRQKIVKSSKVLKAIANPIRLHVIYLLDKKGSMNVNELMTHTRCEQSLLSHHLAAMREKGLLQAKRSGQNIYYSILEKQLSGLVKCIEDCNIEFQKN